MLPARVTQPPQQWLRCCATLSFGDAGGWGGVGGWGVVHPSNLCSAGYTPSKPRLFRREQPKATAPRLNIVSFPSGWFPPYLLCLFILGLYLRSTLAASLFPMCWGDFGGLNLAQRAPSVLPTARSLCFRGITHTKDEEIWVGGHLGHWKFAHQLILHQMQRHIRSHLKEVFWVIFTQ